MSFSRRAWLGAWMLTASVDWCSYSAILRIALGTPTVEIVMLRAPMPTSTLRARCAAMTPRRLSRGSPIPMNTTLDTRRPKWASMVSTWSTISCGRRLRAKPPLPVAQNVQRMGHPTWLDTHTVSRGLDDSNEGMPTVSTTYPSSSLSRNFAVPSLASAMWCTLERPVSIPSSRSAARHALGTCTMSSSPCTLRLYSASWTCLPRYFFSPVDSAISSSSLTDIPTSLVLTTPARLASTSAS
mmetsp:Transcript_32005/g.101918  ORF Transcript_32005/g.101918 Transcript_32005/m.101918 type:complete len:241 (-) Transcript_32005:337-1059(-)